MGFSGISNGVEVIEISLVDVEEDVPNFVGTGFSIAGKRQAPIYYVNSKMKRTLFVLMALSFRSHLNAFSQ